jgi:uncharacterized protein (TIGR02145 family)
MRLGFRMMISALRQGRALLALAAIVAAGSICIFGCVSGIPKLTSGYSEIVPGTVPVDTFWVDDTYKAVKIGDVTWMAENLNIENGTSWCFNNEKNACVFLGRLYNWNTAMNICPPGWHLPSRQEWVDLEAMAGGKNVAGQRLKSKMWKGTDDYGFSARPAGVRTLGEAGVEFRGCSDETMSRCSHGWWTSTECEAESECYGGAYFAELRIGSISDWGVPKGYGFSVRCILND